MLSQVLTVVAASEAIGTEAHQSLAQPRRKLVRNNLHVVTGRDDRSLRALQRLDDVRLLLFFRRVQQIPAIGRQSLAAKLGIAGYAPDIGLHAVLLGKNCLSFKCLVQDRSTAEEL